MSIGPDDRVTVAADVHVRDFDGELVLLDLAKGDYFGVNRVGARVWAGLQEGKTLREIASVLTLEYAVEPGHLLSDLIALTDELLTQGLVIMRNRAPR